LVRKDFFEIVRYAAEKELYVSVASNGTLARALKIFKLITK
jgi:MoaA/NifB/PqqE/SkfB family radical SAM enzyme